MATYRLGRSLALALLGVVVVLIAAGPVAAEPWPVRSLPIFARTAVGLTKAGPFTEMTKPVGFGGSVTWRFATDPILQWSSLTVERADRGTNGKWGPFKAVGTTLVDDTGVAYYAMTSAKALAVSIRALYPATGSLTTADSRSPAREVSGLRTQRIRTFTRAAVLSGRTT